VRHTNATNQLERHPLQSASTPQMRCERTHFSLHRPPFSIRETMIPFCYVPAPLSLSLRPPRVRSRLLRRAVVCRNRCHIQLLASESSDVGICHYTRMCQPPPTAAKPHITHVTRTSNLSFLVHTFICCVHDNNYDRPKVHADHFEPFRTSEKSLKPPTA
jgi:hypothetical protein